MPSSGGSVSDAPVNKVVDGQNHYLAYITPDEGKSLTDQGGKEVITDSGIPAYPPLGKEGTSPGTRSDYTPGQGHRENVGGPPSISAGSAAQASTYTGIPEGGKLGEGSTEIQEDNLITQFKSGVIDKATVIKNAFKLGLQNSKKLADTLGITGVLSLAMGAGGEVQKKAMTWGLENKLKSIQKQKDFHPGAYGYKISDIQSDIEGINDGTFTQKDYTKKYGSGDLGGGNDGGDGDARGLTNIITPYAAHAIGGTTPVNSMAAQWYAGLGSGPSNPGAFNLTQQYAAAKAKVTQRLGTPTSVGQMAVSNSPFFNFLKDNSLNKGIL